MDAGESATWRRASSWKVWQVEPLALLGTTAYIQLHRQSKTGSVWCQVGVIPASPTRSMPWRHRIIAPDAPASPRPCSSTPQRFSWGA